ncbi:sigma 54-interacting transcriptional regulator [Exiguobacterium antarcticum]|uniref:Sigma 54-interacting transcriptional regulator n=1 Tax=Exiguobacterium antarcticum TaxID=132920 RepID=A0ABT6R312_9BACL|nr:sigma 54-interacting transcriptional regulator [Exiguobacterium antarcticum]MDI3235321.1 sigma 54-interacting transcriptional regulator [Exiguobacterium antarcticum]
MHHLLIVGAGHGGTEVLHAFQRSPLLTVIGVVDPNEHAIGVQLAKRGQIRVETTWTAFEGTAIDFIIDATGEHGVLEQLIQFFPEAAVLPGEFVRVLLERLAEKERMLEAIIHCTSEAISVADQAGETMLINPAYTRMTGYTEQDVIGKPASADIGMQESVHLRVLETGESVRDARMKIGQDRRDIIVNAAPVVVDGQVRGSVGVIRDISEMKALTKELKAAKQKIRTLEAKYTFDDIIAESEPMRFVVDQAKLAATMPVNVLIRGESGTGKELFAHAIHAASDRRYEQFVRVNCAAIAPSLLESELFGYEEGAFSGARRGGKRGYFEEAHGGSLFLDEIGELPLDVQAKLLRVLQENEVVRVGGTKAVPVDVRIIAATNANLEQKIITGEFREDLYYRINRLPIHIPALRERPDDLSPLATHLLRKLNQSYGRSVERISEDALEAIRKQTWKGNVRELENVIGRALIFTDKTEQVLRKGHLQLVVTVTPKRSERPKKEIKHLSDEMSYVEEQLIREALDVVNGNKTEAAKQLGISLRALYYKVERFNIQC